LTDSIPDGKDLSRKAIKIGPIEDFPAKMFKKPSAPNARDNKVGKLT